VAHMERMAKAAVEKNLWGGGTAHNLTAIT